MRTLLCSAIVGQLCLEVVVEEIGAYPPAVFPTAVVLASCAGNIAVVLSHTCLTGLA